MPYMPYSTPKYKLRKLRCFKCGGVFGTHNPDKIYCSLKCKKAEEHRVRKARRKDVQVNKETTPRDS